MKFMGMFQESICDMHFGIMKSRDDFGDFSQNSLKTHISVQ